VLGVGGHVLLPHRVEDAALDGLQPVAHVGQRARRDDREGVVEVAGLRRFVQRDMFVGGAGGTRSIDVDVEEGGFLFPAFRHVVT
jgi:hypothetical protein